MTVPTPHISAKKEDLAKVFLMPGDPLRSRYIASAYLEDARLVNDIRGVQGYTGLWKGRRISVMASGVGIPSISVYAYELFQFYDTDVIIRTGTAGSIRKDRKVGDILIADIAYTNSDFLKNFDLPEDYLPKPDPGLLSCALQAAEKRKLPVSTGPVLTEEIYYSMEEGIIEKWARQGVEAFEMEAAALYANAAQAGKKALALFTISNQILTGEEMDPSLRERALDDMITIALDTAWEYAE